MSEQLINVTIDGETYLKYKECYESIKSGKVAISFTSQYEWNFFTEHEALIEMANQFQFIVYKVKEGYREQLFKIEKQLEEKQKELETLKNQ